MRKRQFDPLKLDVAALAQDAESLQGEWPASSLERLSESAPAEAPSSAWAPLRWSVRGEQRSPRGGEPEVWMHVQAEAEVVQTCQRCLQPLREHLQLERSFRFVRDEKQAAELDADSDDDVLVLARHLDLRELLEDELLLALPLVPRHEECPEPLHAPEDPQDEAIEEERPNPFAALAALKGAKGQ